MIINVWNDTPRIDKKSIRGTCTFTCKNGPDGQVIGTFVVNGDTQARWGDSIEISPPNNCVQSWLVVVEIYRNDGRFFRRHTLSKPNLPGLCWPDVKLMIQDNGIYMLES